jgi:hypothetical protein
MFDITEFLITKLPQNFNISCSLGLKIIKSSPFNLTHGEFSNSAKLAHFAVSSYNVQF